jgi:hypothetical protein
MVSNNASNNWQGSQNCTFVGTSTGTLTGSGTGNVAVGNGALNSLTTASNCVGVGLNACGGVTTGIDNVAVGANALTTLSTSVRCVAIGFDALQNCNGTSNVGIGYHSGQLITTGTNNLCIGTLSLNALLTGTNNVGIGASAATNYTGSESNNIVIGGVAGTAGESGVIRLGGGSQSTCFIAGINGVTVTGTAVLCATNGQLGTVVSSERYKENILSLDEFSSKLLQCIPVSFNYKIDENKAVHFGLIAEEVHKILPELVILSESGQPESVAYHEMPAMLLNEIIKLRKRIEILEKKIDNDHK